MNDEDSLRDSLVHISDQATPVDFLDRSLARSKRIGRNRAMLTSAAVVLVLAVTGGIAWQFGRPQTNQPTPAIGQSATPSPSDSPSPSASPSQSPSSSPATAGLTGRFYYTDLDKVLRLTSSGTQTVLPAGGYTANISPDGASIAFVDAGNNVVVADRDGQHHRTVLHDAIGVGYEPAWSPDSHRLLVAKNGGTGKTILGILTLASGSFTPLPHQLQAIHPLWSADGQHLGYATGTCQIGTADADGANPHLVPNYGDRKRRSCDPYSISPDGRYIAVNQRTGDQPNGDIGRDLTANTVIDTRTGANITLPVKGTITAILFQPNGDILVRSGHQLTLLNPDHTIKTQMTEPATATNTRLLGYTQK